MNINNIETLIEVIQNATPQKALEIITYYGNKRETKGIEDGWKRSRVVQRFAVKSKREQLKKHLLNFDEGSNSIPDVEFVRFFAGIEDCLVNESQNMPEEVREFAASIQDLMWSKLGNVKPDRRITFRND